MQSSLNAQDVLADIEFELVQGALSRDELGESIRTVRQYQSKLRREMLQENQKPLQMREMMGRQFQLNDMLLTLLQETAVSLHDLNLKVTRTARLKQGRMPSTGEDTPSSSPSIADAAAEESFWRETKAVNQLRIRELPVHMDVRPTAVPLIGPLLNRLRVAFHSLVVHYLRIFAGQQHQVNATLADWILYQDALHRFHTEENARLRQQLAGLQERLARLEGEADHPSEPVD